MSDTLQDIKAKVVRIVKNEVGVDLSDIDPDGP